MDCHKKTWKNKHKHNLGYIVIPVTRGRNGKKELEHRLVMEKMIGRKLRRGEVVHHKNYDRADNRPENLELCASAGIHARDHHRKEILNGIRKSKANDFSGSKKK